MLPTPQYVNDEVVKASVPEVPDLRDAFQLVVDGLYDGPLPEHHFRLRQRPITVIIALLSLLYGIFFHHGVKKLAEIVCNTK